MHFVGWDQQHGYAQRIIGDVPESAYLAAGWKLREVLGDLVDTPGMSLTGVVKSGPGRTGYHAYDEAVTGAAVQWLGERGRYGDGKPFLLTVGYASPHCPFVAPPQDFERYAKRINLDDLPVPGKDLHPLVAERRRQFGTDPAPPLDAQWRTRVAYYGLCSFMDRQIESVLSALADSGMADSTIVVYVSDHGEMLGEHGMWWKSTFYDGACRVPLIVSWPSKIRGGRTVPQNVSLMDVGATVLDLVGVDPLPSASGRSFHCLLAEDEGRWDDTVFAEFATPGSDPPGRMVRSGPWKYNYHHGMRPELFNLADDPEELNDLWDDPRFESVRLRLHDLVLRGWEPDRVAERMRTRGQERELIGSWVKATGPAEPDALWFDEPPENWVDNTVKPSPPSDGIG